MVDETSDSSLECAKWKHAASLPSISSNVKWTIPTEPGATIRIFRSNKADVSASSECVQRNVSRQYSQLYSRFLNQKTTKRERNRETERKSKKGLSAMQRTGIGKWSNNSRKTWKEKEGRKNIGRNNLQSTLELPWQCHEWPSTGHNLQAARADVAAGK